RPLRPLAPRRAPPSALCEIRRVYAKMARPFFRRRRVGRRRRSPPRGGMGQSSWHFRGNDRFTVRRRLGAGGLGADSEAVERDSHQTVALKTLTKADGAAIYRFKREFRALADVTHPNLVSLYELVADGEAWFFTMELVDGTNFLEYVRGRSGAGVPTT